MTKYQQLDAVLAIVSSRPTVTSHAGQATPDGRIVVITDLSEQPVVSRHIFGLFLEHLGRCIYGGVWGDCGGPARPLPCSSSGTADSGQGHARGTEDAVEAGLRVKVVEALRELRAPNLRWPGGCFADGYHWKDGIGPQSQRPRTVNQHWGGVVESNAFGSNEFMNLCAEVGAEPFIVGNVVSIAAVVHTLLLTLCGNDLAYPLARSGKAGLPASESHVCHSKRSHYTQGSGSPSEMRDWLEYLSYGGDSTLARLRKAHGVPKPWPIRLWGVGNESWGCGGFMDVETYAREYRRFAAFLQLHNPVCTLCRVACGANGDDFDWCASLYLRSDEPLPALCYSCSIPGCFLLKTRILSSMRSSANDDK